MPAPRRAMRQTDPAATDGPLADQRLQMEAERRQALAELEQIRRHHAGAPGAKGGWLRASVFGINDGLVSNLSLVAGVSAAASGREFVLLAGLAGLVAGSFSMAAGEYISMKAQREVFEALIAQERWELRNHSREERDEIA